MDGVLLVPGSPNCLKRDRGGETIIAVCARSELYKTQSFVKENVFILFLNVKENVCSKIHEIQRSPFLLVQCERNRLYAHSRTFI